MVAIKTKQETFSAISWSVGKFWCEVSGDAYKYSYICYNVNEENVGGCRDLKPIALASVVWLLYHSSLSKGTSVYRKICRSCITGEILIHLYSNCFSLLFITHQGLYSSPCSPHVHRIRLDPWGVSPGPKLKYYGSYYMGSTHVGMLAAGHQWDALSSSTAPPTGPTLCQISISVVRG